MADIHDPSNHQPPTRREVLERGPSERGFLGDRVALTTATEPRPEVHEVLDSDAVLKTEGPGGLVFQNRGILIGAFAMVFINLITFWMPGMSALLAGAFGGFFAKRWKSGMVAAAIASVALPATLAFLRLWMRTDTSYFLLGINFFLYALLNAVCLFLGAAAGVYSRPLAERRGLSREVLT